MQTTSHLLMIRPVRFTFNEQTAVNNAFQTADVKEDTDSKAMEEFDAFAALLRKHDIDVTIVEDTPEPHTPDSVFPNNWISFHKNGSIVLYPMFAPNRRAERKPHVIKAIEEKFAILHTLDMSFYEKMDRFLEGTGSMILDRENHLAYACLSPRTDKDLVEEFCRQMQLTPVCFIAKDEKGGEIYHTNVMMCIASDYAVVCADAIVDEHERRQVLSQISHTGKDIIKISLQQMNAFAGNMLQVKNQQGQHYLVMSSQAYHSLSKEQIESLESFNPILHANLQTIETNGGGSARCMLAEIFLPVK